jgi:hypothetical protein
MMSRASFTAALALVLGCAALALQKPAPPATATAAPPTAIPAAALAMMPKPALGDTLRAVTHIGSFKIVPKGEELPSGRLEFSFSGTVLVSGLDPASYLKVTGNVRKEYESKPNGKDVYFGNGKILIVGKFRNCEWFGRNLDFTFKGSGVVRIIAEFDKNGDTGTFWYDPTEKSPLQVNLLPLEVPKNRGGLMKAIMREDYEKQKKQQQKGG